MLYSVLLVFMICEFVGAIACEYYFSQFAQTLSQRINRIFYCMYMISRLTFFIGVLLTFHLSAKAQIFQQNFNKGGAIGAYVNVSEPNDNQFNVISNYPNFSRSFKDGKLVFKKTGSSSVNIARATDLADGDNLKALKISFKLKVAGEAQSKSGIFTHGKFIVGDGLDATSTSYPDEQSESASFVFNFPISKVGELFQGFKIGGKGSANEIFFGEKEISLFINIAEKAIQYYTPEGEVVNLQSGKFEVWVGNLRVITDATVKNRKNIPKNFKLLIAPQAPNGLELSFDDFVVSKLN